MDNKQPDISYLKEKLELRLPLIGFYDAPDPEKFPSPVRPDPGQCLFAFYDAWRKGKTLLLTEKQYGCGGCGRWMFNIQTRSRSEFLEFLVDGEGLKASTHLMAQWIDSGRTYQRKHPFLLVGPLLPEQWSYCRSVTFFVNPDQLSALMIGAQYHSVPGDPTPVIAPFGSGCMEIFPFENPAAPQASIGATDIAMRNYLPADILAFTVTPSLFARLCSLDKHSFLAKPFLANLKKARGGSIT